jgi:cyclophilin family peptidyl-prolyl cis-trans isomerase
MLRLEDRRILRDPDPPPRLVLRPATDALPAVFGPPAPSDLARLLEDEEARVRRRAALAVGRVGLVEGVEPLGRLLGDADPEVRQMAAFALGLIGDASGRPALLRALADDSPAVQGRSAEALGSIGDRRDAAAVAAMVERHVQAGALQGVEADELGYPLAPEVEAARLGVYALARLGSYDGLASAVLDGSGQPLSRWWPVAYALQRVADPRAMPALLALAETPGRYTASFAVRGLGTMKAREASALLRRIVEQRSGPPAVVLQAIRALGAMGDAAAAPLLTSIVGDAGAEATLRRESMAALGAVVGPAAVDLLLDLLTDADPPVRAAALVALARVAPDAFLATLAGLDRDRDWTVRAAIAGALGGLTPPGRGVPRLALMLRDDDPRVVAAAVSALAASNAREAEPLLVAQLTHADVAVRAAAAAGLAGLKATASFGAVAEAYRAAERDDSYVARAAALAALDGLAPEAARPLLAGALGDRDWAVRVRAAALLAARGDNEAHGRSRPVPGTLAAADPAWRAMASPPFSPHAFLETDKGTIEIELAIADAPQAVRSFMALARKGFYAGLAIHRVVPDFVVQVGDPRGDGEGGPGYTIRDEINQRPYLRGTVGMALDWKDTGGSQFFITHAPAPHLDGRYTVFGHVVAGMDVVDRLVRWDVVRSVRIWDGVTASR